MFSGANTYVGPGCAWGVGELVDGGGGGGAARTVLIEALQWSVGLLLGAGSVEVVDPVVWRLRRRTRGLT